MLSFLNAFVFMVFISVAWVPLVALFLFAAFCVGAMLVALYFSLGVYIVVNSIFGFTETNMPFWDSFLKVLGKIFGQIPDTISRLWNWGKIVPDWLWEFARYDHPWIALIITLIFVRIVTAFYKE